MPAPAETSAWLQEKAEIAAAEAAREAGSAAMSSRAPEPPGPPSPDALRIAAILRLPAAEGRRALAEQLAFHGDLDVEACARALECAPRALRASLADRLGGGPASLGPGGPSPDRIPAEQRHQAQLVRAFTAVAGVDPAAPGVRTVGGDTPPPDLRRQRRPGS